MILNRAQADAVEAMGDFLVTNPAYLIYSVVMKAMDDPPGPSFKTTTLVRATVAGVPLGTYSLLVKRSTMPDENYASLNDFVTAYAFV